MAEKPLKQPFTFTLEDIRAWGGDRLFTEALEQYANKGDVVDASFENDIGEADISHAGHAIHTRFRTFPTRRTMVENLCPCAASKRDGRICVHMLAAAIGLYHKTLRLRGESVPNIISKVSAEKAAVVKQSVRIKPRLEMARRIKSVKIPNSPRLGLYVPENWLQRFDAGEVPLALSISSGVPKPYSLHDIVDCAVEFDPIPEEADVLFALEQMFPKEQEISTRKNLPLQRKHFFALLDRLGDDGISINPLRSPPIRVMPNSESLRSVLHIGLEESSGRLELSLEVCFPDGDRPEAFPRFFVSRDPQNWKKDRVYVFHKNTFWPLKTPIPSMYGNVYFQKSFFLQRHETIDFIRREFRGETRTAGKLKSLREILGDNIEVSFDFSIFTIKPGIPRFKLYAEGSRASIKISLSASYSRRQMFNLSDDDADTVSDVQDDITVEVKSSKPTAQFTLPDPEDNYCYYTRNVPAEIAALAKLAERGLACELEPDDDGTRNFDIPPIVDSTKVLSFLGSTMPALRAHGWEVELGPSLTEFNKNLVVVAPHVDIVDKPETNSFEISYSMRSSDGLVTLSDDDLSQIPQGISHINHNGTTIVFDKAGLEELDAIIAECEGQPLRKSTKNSHHGAPRVLSNSYTHFVKTAIDGLKTSGVVIEGAPKSWMSAADIGAIRRSLKPAPIGEPIRSLLRPYQTTGTAWLRYLEVKHQGGILADEMGLGKTIQTLAWLSLPRVNGSTAPALVVCPTSLVQNWSHECRHFTPELKCIVMAGAQRHEDFVNIPNCNLVITSYALMRRDIDEYRRLNFSVVVLDEAQNIKNQNTLNARSVKQLDPSACRLVVTGTPIENSVSDLWSIMDFLMPGYLGHYETFKRIYEEPLQLPVNTDAYQDASKRLHAKLAPFLMRRLKRQVARDLPPKIIRTSWCELSAEQQALYDRILEESRLEVSGSVSKIGFEKSRMLILTALLRLRQVCCHMGLVNPTAAARASVPSAKLEMLMELLNESISQGHRILVFSQFVNMLKILSDEFKRKKIKFCYLDGTTKDRMGAVTKFNSDSSIPVFLISLKAGGTGLNLTGADEVVHFDPWWNPSVEDQATDRAHRIGQKNTVYSIKLITTGTIEERVLQMQRRKRAIIDSTVEGDDQTMAKLTWADVKKLLDIE